MKSLMMNDALSITSIMEFADKSHASQEIVSLTGEDQIHRFSYAQTFARTRQLANALNTLNIQAGDRVATLAWNDHRHFELYYAISCVGAICHTVNPRLFEEQITYIIGHAEDCGLFFDPAFLPIVESLEDQMPSVKNFVILCNEDEMPTTSLNNTHCYETLIKAESTEFDWPELDENMASSLCYTSGTTGNPKGVLYSHRSNVLHSYGSALPDSMDLSSLDTVLPVVPMFHANAWGLNYSVPMVGAKFVLPGSKAGDPQTLTKLVNEENVTLTAGVPTVWLALLQYLEKTKQTLPSLQRALVAGSACPPAIIDEFLEKHEVETLHAWGMTELSPLGTIFSPKPGFKELSEREQDALKAKQGRPFYGINIKITGDDGSELPWDGTAFGSLKVKGPWVCDGYYKTDKQTNDDGWFETGDIATINKDGYMSIVDRNKDVIKSGGEWISSIALENVAQNHELIQEVAVIGIADPEWGERPMLVVVLADAANDSEKTKEDILSFMVGKVAKWWIPERIEFVDSIPHTATGKISKLTLRERFS